MRLQQVALALVVLACLGRAAVAQVSANSPQTPRTGALQGATTTPIAYSPQTPYASQPSPFAAEYSAQGQYDASQGPYADKDKYRAMQEQTGQTSNAPSGPTPFADIYASGVQQQPSTPPNRYAGGNSSGLAGIADDDYTTWMFRFDELFIQRSTTHDQVLFRDVNTGDTLLNSSNGLNFPVAAGLQAFATRRINECWDLDVGYFQLDGWNADASSTGQSQLITDAVGSGFFVTGGAARYTSAVYLGEVNVRRHIDWLTLLGGFRMGELNEHYLATGMEDVTMATLTNNTFNHLYGFQIGADIDVFSEGTPWRINVLGNVGVYGNTMTRNAQRVGFDVNDFQSASRNGTACISEVGVKVSYHFSKRLAAHALYQAMWMDGVALAPEQVGVTNFGGFGTVNSTGSLFYHGAGIGLDLAF